MSLSDLGLSQFYDNRQFISLNGHVVPIDESHSGASCIEMTK